MATVWANIVSAIAALIKPLVAWFIYNAGQRAEATRATAEANKATAELKDEYAETIAADRNSDTALERMRSGEY